LGPGIYEKMKNNGIKYFENIIYADSKLNGFKMYDNIDTVCFGFSNIRKIAVDLGLQGPTLSWD
jgi:hypothetical protein